MLLIVLVSIFGICFGDLLDRGITNDQFHNQDSFGQYKYGYVNGESSKEESRSLDGVTRGSYSYMDADGVLQKVFYQADAEHGFIVSGTNIPSAPIAPDGTDEITPAFSTKLYAAARKIGESSERNKIGDQTEEDVVKVEDKDKNNNREDKPDSANKHVENVDNNYPNVAQQQDDSGDAHYLFPLARPNNNNIELSSPPHSEYLMPLLTNFDLYIPPDQMPPSQGYGFRDRVTFLPIYQPDYIPPFARSYYRSPFAFLNGFIPMFRAERTGLLSRIPKFDQRGYFNHAPNKISDH